MSDVTATDRQLTIMGRSVDRATTVEMRLGVYSRGVAADLYGAALEAQGGAPLSLLAASRLHGAVGKGDTVLIATGAGHVVHMPAGETDGPLGAVALGRILERGLGAVPVFVTAAEYAAPLEAAAEAAGLETVSILHVSSDERAVAECAGFLDRHRPAAVVSVETLSPNAAGVSHTASGMATSEVRPRIEELFYEAARRGVPTVGVGDNGNEIGFGLVEPAVRALKPFGDVCRCDCGAGIASAVATDVLVAANISNWGAYGIEAMLAALLGDPGLIHDGEIERRMLERSVEAGAIDGSTGKKLEAVDGSDLAVQQALLTFLRAIVANGLSEPPNRPF
jgi:hypothetical protein